MNTEDLLTAIGSADEAMLEKSEKKKNAKKHWLVSVAAAAACFALLLSIFWPEPTPNHSGPSHGIVPGDNFEAGNPFWIGELDYSVPENFRGSGESGGGGCAGGPPMVTDATYQFGREKSVHVAIKQILPDTYCFLNSVQAVQAYRILHLQVLDTIVGENMPSEIYYLMPAYLSADILEYDSFIMTVDQVGLENYVMINATQKCTEMFTLLFRSAGFNACYGSVLAFSGDQLDVSLWDKDGWNLARDEVTTWVSDSSYTQYPGKIHRNVEDTKAEILNARANMNEQYHELTSVITSNDFAWEEARQALAHIASFGEGSFWHSFYSEGNYMLAYCRIYEIQAVYTRFVNGFRTNEDITIWTLVGDVDDYGGTRYQEVRYSYEHFTQEDLNNLPDLAGFIENAAKFSPPEREEAVQLQLNRISGEYIKYHEHVFGFVTCSWIYKDDSGTHTVKSYYLVFPDNTYQETGISGAIETTDKMEDWIARQENNERTPEG